MPNLRLKKAPRGRSVRDPQINGKPTDGKPTNGKPTNGKPTNGSPTEAAAAARAAGMRYVTDAMPGIHRLRSGKGFRFKHPDGRPVRDQDELQRIRSLAIPPAWTDVWICPHAQGHLQATGRDARGRKQFRYHPKFREIRDENKFGRMIAFGLALPKIRSRVTRDMKKRGLPREKVLATLVRLLETTFIRIGNEIYARENGSVGLTTMRDRHVRVRGGKIQFDFKGKSGVQHAVELEDTGLAKIVKACQDLPGQELFQYHDEAGEVKDVGSGDVNEYLRAISGEDFTAKDFRTWAGTLLAASALQEVAIFSTQREAKQNANRAIESVSKQLGNTKAICRKCYIHPALIEAFLEGNLADSLTIKAKEVVPSSLRRDEGIVLAFLQRLQKLPGKKRLRLSA